jgi:hypothetical protein
MSFIGNKWITTNSITNSSLIQVPEFTLKGNNTGSIANVADLTLSQINAMLPTFTTLNGLVPGTASSTTNFLRADGTWNAPTGTHINQGASVAVPTQTSTGSGLTFTSGNATYDQNTFTGTNQFTAKRTGLHLVTIVCQYDDYTGSDHTTVNWLYISYAVNGGSSTNFASCTGSNTNAAFYATGSVVLNLTAGNTVTFIAESQSGSNIINTILSFTEIGVA